MQLFVRGLQGQTLLLHAHGSDTIAELKNAIHVRHGIPAAEQLLTASGRVLVDADTLACAGLQQDSTVQLLLRLCGGKGGFGALLRGQGRDGKITDNFDACRDLSGRRIRHVEAEKKLEDWKKEAKERELEKLAMKHMKEMAKQAKQERDFQVNVEEVKREHKKAADAVVEAVHTALTEGLQQQRKHGAGGSMPGSGAAAAAAGSSKAAAAAEDAGGPASPGSKRKAAAEGAAGAAAAAEHGDNNPAKKRQRTMLDMVAGAESDSDDSSSSDGDSDADE